MKLVVALDSVALLRESRGTPYPDPVAAAALAEMGGASGVSLRVRTERRQIGERDLEALRRGSGIPITLHTAANQETLKLGLTSRPNLLVLVPERREESGWENGIDVLLNTTLLSRTVMALLQNNLTVGIRVEPDADQIKAVKKLDVTHVEISCGRYSDARKKGSPHEEWERLAQAVKVASRLGLTATLTGMIDYQSAAELARLEDAEAMVVGHAIVARAVLTGLEQATRDMVTLLRR